MMRSLKYGAFIWLHLYEPFTL